MSQIDLDQLKRDGLNPEQVAADVARLLGHGDTCEGPFTYKTMCNDGGDYVYRTCRSCSYAKGFGGRVPATEHKRIPLPVDVVRLELLEQLGRMRIIVEVTYGISHRTSTVRLIGHSEANVKAIAKFTNLTDESLALGVAAVELFREKG